MQNWHLLSGLAGLFASGAALLATGFTPIPAAILLAGAGLVVFLMASGPVGSLLQSRVDWLWFGQCLGIALLCAVVGGEGHFVFTKDDWLYRDAVLADVTAHWLPVVYSQGADKWLLRAPLGMYLLPGAIGRVLGLSAAHIAMLLQNGLILGGVFYLSTLAWPKRRLLFVLLFIVFSGIDVIPVLLRTKGAYIFVNLSFWSELWHYMSHLSQFFWCPNHALPGWFFAVLAALYLKGEIDFAALCASTLPLIIWSPLALFGGAGLLFFFFLRAPAKVLARRFAASCGAGAAFTPALAYLGLDASSVPHEWLIFDQNFFGLYPFFVIFALPQGFFLLLFRDRIEPWFRAGLFCSFGMLLIMPFYSAGSMNDFSQRASIAPQALVAFGFNALVIDLLASGAISALAAAVSIVAAAVVTPALEVYDALRTPAFSVSDCNFLTVDKKIHPKAFPTNYLARLANAPEWVTRRAAETRPSNIEERLCWPDRVYGEKAFNWLRPEHRIWLRAPSPEDLRQQSK